MWKLRTDKLLPDIRNPPHTEASWAAYAISVGGRTAARRGERRGEEGCRNAEDSLRSHLM